MGVRTTVLFSAVYGSDYVTARVRHCSLQCRFQINYNLLQLEAICNKNYVIKIRTPSFSWLSQTKAGGPAFFYFRKCTPILTMFSLELKVCMQKTVDVICQVRF